MTRTGYIAVRATVNLPGLHAGGEAWADDPPTEYVRDALAAGFLVLVDGAEPPPVPESPA